MWFDVDHVSPQWVSKRSIVHIYSDRRPCVSWLLCVYVLKFARSCDYTLWAPGGSVIDHLGFFLNTAAVIAKECNLIKKVVISRITINPDLYVSISNPLLTTKTSIKCIWDWLCISCSRGWNWGDEWSYEGRFSFGVFIAGGSADLSSRLACYDTDLIPNLQWCIGLKSPEIPHKSDDFGTISGGAFPE